MDVICQKCLTLGHGDRSKDVVGAPCQTPGCDGILERQPKFSELVDELPEPMTCASRMQQLGPWEHGPGLDRWQKFKKNGDRVCSFCGSLHPDDFLAIAKLAAEAPAEAKWHEVAEVEQADKSYKVYVHRPGVRNAMEGGIKFYKYHLPAMVASTEVLRDFRLAIQASQRRFEIYMATQYPPREPGRIQ